MDLRLVHQVGTRSKHGGVFCAADTRFYGVGLGLNEFATELPGLFVIERKPVRDDRGFLERLLCTSGLRCWGNRRVIQINRTLTHNSGVIRGLHFQYSPHAEAKYVCCLKGIVFDVVLDLRKNSHTYGHFFSIELNASKHQALVIPEGCAHGFQTITDNVEMLYFHSCDYSPDHQSGINAFDESLNIPWPVGCTMISERDQSLPKFETFKGLSP